MAISCDEQDIVCSNYKDGQVLHRWKGHTGSITAIAVNSVTRRVYSASRDQSILSWSLDDIDQGDIGVSGTPHGVYKGHEMGVAAVDVSADGSLLATGSRDNSVRVWSAANSQCIVSNKIQRNLVWSVRWLTNSNVEFAQCGEDKQLKVWDIRDGKSLQPVQKFPLCSSIQTCVNCNTEGNYLITGARGNNGFVATVYDRRTLSEFTRLNGSENNTYGAIFSPLEGTVITGSDDHLLRLWKFHTPLPSCIVTTSASGSIGTLNANPVNAVVVDGDNILCATHTSGISVHRLAQDVIFFERCY